VQSIYRSAQKTIDREVSHVQNAVADVERALKSEHPDLENLAALMAVVEERDGEYLFYDFSLSR
jgi:hypothetical protein